ncbi:M28 family peptidase [Archangium violaceum]|uniref:M28 family peptidase n=1 Tax=Archangium violaceum TaxID=83451 RepID=UPI0019528863|nr:M28 family peptidase [Archangium violaceum]QRN94795.1 M28 family peptidase [Archangium violaceum]
MKLRLPRGVLAALPLLALTTCAPAVPTFPELELEKLAELAGKVDAERLMAHVRNLAESHQAESPLTCSDRERENYEPTCHLTRDNARELMKKRLEALGLQVRLQEGEDSGFQVTNVVAELPGTTRPEEVVLVGAHFDAFYMGADDNASGVAAVLELARVFSQYRFERTVRFVGFDLEERGFLGSTQLVNALGGEHLTAALVFDSIGYYDSTPGSQTSIPGLPSPDTGDFLAAIGNDGSRQFVSELYELNRRLGLMKVVPIIAPGEGATPISGNLMRSDHSPFWLTGRNAVFLTDTADFRNANYHTDKDVPETLSPEPFRQAVRVSAVSLAWWAGGPR